MPTYTYKCKNDHIFDLFLTFSESEHPQKCECGSTTERYFSPDSMPSFIISKFESYESPMTGEVIRSNKHRLEDMEKHGCVEYDPEIKTDQRRNAEDTDKAIEKDVDETVEKAFGQMTADEKKAIAIDMATTAEEYTRI